MVQMALLLVRVSVQPPCGQLAQLVADPHEAPDKCENCAVAMRAELAKHGRSSSRRITTRMSALLGLVPLPV